MAESALEPDLADRLTRLRDTDPACCAADLRSLVEDLREAPSFEATLSKAKALSDPNRLTALRLLLERGELCACEIQAALAVTHATVSHHMERLVEAGLVTRQRRGAWVHYAPSEDARNLLEVLSA